MPTQGVNAVKRALLIGIGDYPSESGWTPIHSYNDMAIVGDLLKLDGYTTDKCVESQATHKGIIRSLENLVSETLDGDQVWIHLSGHGQQMYVGISEEEPDGLDETFVAYDALLRPTDEYHGQNHLRDSELGAYIRKISQKAGPSGLVMVTIDACHSDSMDRDAEDDEEDEDVEDVEGEDNVLNVGQEPESEKETGKNSTENLKSKIFYRGVKDIFGKPEGFRPFADSEDMVLKKEPYGSDIVIISACKNHQVNQEVKINDTYYGSLSNAICKAYHKGIPLEQFVRETLRNMSYLNNQTPCVRSTIAPLTTLNLSNGPKIEVPDRDPSNSRGGSVTGISFMGIVGLIGLGCIIVAVIIILLQWNRKRKN